MEKEVVSLSLSSDEVQKRLSHYGQNILPEKKPPSLAARFLSQFKNALMLLLVSAGFVSFLVGEGLDAIFIFLIVLLNASFGLYQEFKAEKALLSLKELTITTVRVIRDGYESEIDSRDLVPGDIFHLEEGDKVPADGEILISLHLEANEAALTGESFPVEKSNADDEKKQIFMGTTVVKGRGYSRVTSTGRHTKFGKIAQSLGEIEEGKTPLQKKLESFTKQVGFIGIGAAFAVFFLSFISEKTVLESFLFAVSLAVAAVPEGLPAVMTITLALGVERMAKKNAIVRKLNAIETLGSVTVIATDKTGTLTTNKMRVKSVWLAGKVSEVSSITTLKNKDIHLMLTNGLLCSTATLVQADDGSDKEPLGDPTEGAILLFASRFGMVQKNLQHEWKTLDEISFNPVTKRMSVVSKKGNDMWVFTKGAPESVLSICSMILWNGKSIALTQTHRTRIEKDFQTFAKKGQRMIAFSYKNEAPTTLRSGYLLPTLRLPAGKAGREQNPSEAKRHSLSSPIKSEYFAKGDKTTDQIEKNHVFLGFVGIADPLRTEVKQAVQKAHTAGIQVVMITGDNELTAQAIGSEAGITHSRDLVITGKKLEEYTDDQILPLLSKIKIFARTTPDQKYRLVKLYQQLGETVAVTGDGVNDAIALKQSDVGVAMGKTGTDVAKETADMVLTDDNFATLVGAIEEGRHIVVQIKNTIKYLLSCNLGEILYIIPAVVFNMPILTALQILYMNIATDGMPAISLAFTNKDPRTMSHPPRKSVSILDATDYRYLLFVGFLTALSGYVSQLLGNSTIVFTTIMLVQHFILIDVWLSHRYVLKNIFSLKHPVFLLAFFLPIVAHPVILYHPFFQKIFQVQPLSLYEVGYAIGISLFILLLLELGKFYLSSIRPSRSLYR